MLALFLLVCLLTACLPHFVVYIYSLNREHLYGEHLYEANRQPLFSFIKEKNVDIAAGWHQASWKHVDDFVDIWSSGSSVNFLISGRHNISSTCSIELTKYNKEQIKSKCNAQHFNHKGHVNEAFGGTLITCQAGPVSTAGPVSIFAECGSHFYGSSKFVIRESSSSVVKQCKDMHFSAATYPVGDEWRLIRQWIAYYFLMGVQQFFVYDMEIGGSSKLINEIQGLQEKGVFKITYIPWSYRAEHNPYLHKVLSHNHAIHRFGRTCAQSKWMLLVDPDEYVFPVNGSLRRLLLNHEHLENVGGLHFQDVFYGSMLRRGTTNLAIDRFVWRVKEPMPLGTRGKTIVNVWKADFYLAHWVTWGSPMHYVNPAIAMNRHFRSALIEREKESKVAEIYDDSVAQLSAAICGLIRTASCDKTEPTECKPGVDPSLFFPEIISAIHPKHSW